MKKEKYKITVSEPWNYDGPDGPNIIYGTILRQVDRYSLIFKSDNELKFDGNKGKYLILECRSTDDLLQENLNYYATINGALILNSPNTPFDSLKNNSKFVLIGRIEKL